MFLALWNYLRGYVIIEVSGFSVERFINLAVHKGVYIWDMVRESEAATMKVSIKGFKLLRSCAKKTKCKVNIKDKKGLPFITFKYRKRKLLAFGMLLFIFTLFFLSSFVWLLEVEGNHTVSSSEITDFLKKNGLSVGTFKYGVNEKELEKMIIFKYGEVSWINIHISGTKATVRITEAIPKRKIVDTSIPCDIVAAKDGLVTSIATMTGTPKIKEGDVVQEGDLLVSGELLIGTEDAGFKSEYVHAQSEVRAKMYHEVGFSVPLEYEVRVYTGNEKKDRGVIFFNSKINLIKTSKPYQYYDKITSREQLDFGEDYPLPVIITTDTYKEYLPETRIRTVEEAMDIAESMITSKIISEFDFDVDVADKAVEYNQAGDRLEVKALITTIERIDRKRAIQGAEAPLLEF